MITMNKQFSRVNGMLDQEMSDKEFDLIISAIIDGKYSFACILMLRHYGYDPRDYIPYGTYNRLIKKNFQLEKRKPALAKHFSGAHQVLGNSLGLSKESKTTTYRSPSPDPNCINSEIKSTADVKSNPKDLSKLQVYQCQCPICQQPGDSALKQQHAQMNLLLSRLNEQQRRWYVALEAKKLGHGGIKYMSQVTGMHSDTIRRGRNELDNFLAERPVERVRQVGGGRKAARPEPKAPIDFGLLGNEDLIIYQS